MAIAPIKILLFLAGGLVAVGATAYVSGALDPYLAKQAPAVASLPDEPQAKAVPETAPATGETPAMVEPPPPMAQTPGVQPSTDAAAEPPVSAPPGIIAPSFDVVRVEGDGSIVIAGKAAPGARVEIVTGSKVIGEAVAGAGGDFAVVLDDPLEPGGYQIVLRSTTPDNVAAMSVETAVVSVPETEDGQVLALVEEPGKPSEMISVPEPEAKPETPQASDQASAPAAAAPKPADQVEAALQPEPAPAAKPASPAATGPAVAVEAVEIEGRTIFVAGTADPGRKVRGYANDILLGDAEASAGGRFLIEAERDLPVGDYIIRVDALEPDGVKVAARAAVPFEREPGEAIAAIAPPAAEPPDAVAGASVSKEPSAEAPPVVADAPPAAGTDAAKPEPKPAAAAPVQAPPVVAESPVEGSPSVAETPPPEAPAVAEAPSAGSEADVAMTEAPVVQPTPPDAAETIAQAPPPELAAPANQAATETPASAPAQPETIAEAPVAAESPTTTQPASPSMAAEAPAVATEPNVEVAEAPADGKIGASDEDVPTTMAPKLQSVDGAVIIRRGDTLWRISRRVYGRGIRYSTIYLANQKQIEDPDRIWPGQVFTVPEKTKEGVEADLSRMGDQATTVPQ